MPNNEQLDFSNVTQIDLAAAFGVSAKSIQNWARAGLPRLKTGRYDLPACIRWYGTHCDCKGTVHGGGG